MPLATVHQRPVAEHLLDRRSQADGVGFSNRPGEPETVFGNGFLPLRRPGLLEPGDQVVVDLRAELVVGEYVWRWNTTVTGADGEPKWRYRQSTSLGVRLASTHVSTLGEDGEVDRHVLEAMAGGRSLGAIARELATRFPGRFSMFKAALDHVADLSVRYKS